jgi:hypothetical protein
VTAAVSTGEKFHLPEMMTMGTIDHLLDIRAERRPEDRIWRISLTPYWWFLLQAATDVEIHMIDFGFSEEELGFRIHGSEYLYTGNGLFGVTVDPSQNEGYRLWDPEGREVIIDPKRRDGRTRKRSRRPVRSGG